jgi:CRP/FNR family transcriptional regulator, anaerobic regulatory protein
MVRAAAPTGMTDLMRPALPQAHCRACTVRSLALFSAFGSETLDALTWLRRDTRMVPAGGSLVSLDEVPGELFTVYRGWAFSYRLTHEGRRQIIDFHLPGDLIGVELLAAQPADYGVQALTAVSVCVFGATPLLHAATERPELGAALAWMAARSEASLAERLAAVGRRDAVPRLAHLLLDLWTRQRWRERRDDDGCQFPATNGQLADALGLTPEHISRSLGRLRAEHGVTLARGTLHIPSPAVLGEWAGWSPAYLEARPLI